MIAGVLLAAGEGRRFGAAASKLSASLGGMPVVRRAAGVLVAAGLYRVVVVVGAAAASVRAALDGLDVVFVENARFAEGIGASVAAGIAVLGDASAAVIALGDQPFVAAAVVDALVAEYRATGAAIVAPSYEGVRGNPVLFDRGVFPELLALGGDVGAREVIARDPARVRLVAVASPTPADVDTPADLARLMLAD